ncbi:MAG: hypothetical protein K6C05_08235 [Anaerovibrio sp.]|uniref:hypothetical protein n=1 Tax=Anaerovibrio sp. TaxID=1872532 RepID=UPI0025FBE229|nr:hypothetical protein [Anaerovibrio sp.]MCR5176824.1 hypothetical protein [Anaerovibrio sp.]
MKAKLIETIDATKQPELAKIAIGKTLSLISQEETPNETIMVIWATYNDENYKVLEVVHYTISHGPEPKEQVTVLETTRTSMDKVREIESYAREVAQNISRESSSTEEAQARLEDYMDEILEHIKNPTGKIN